MMLAAVVVVMPVLVTGEFADKDSSQRPTRTPPTLLYEPEKSILSKRP